MQTLTFTTIDCWQQAAGFGCASLALPGNDTGIATYENPLEGVTLTGTYEEILVGVRQNRAPVYAAIVVFGNAGGENRFLRDLQELIACPIVGGGAAFSQKPGLVTGGGQAAVFLICDDRYTYEAVTQCIHDEILEDCQIKMRDLRTLATINGVDAAEYLAKKKVALGLPATDFEHLTLTDLSGINAHLSQEGTTVKSGRDLCDRMQLRYVAHEKVYGRMERFYEDPDAIIFGCAGLSGLLDKPLKTTSLGLYLFGEVCMTEGRAEFGNLMLSKLRIYKK